MYDINPSTATEVYPSLQNIVLENFIHKIYTQLLFYFDYKYAMNAFHH